MASPHQGEVGLRHTFDEAHDWLFRNGSQTLRTRIGTPFEARASITRRGRHRGQYVIIFSRNNKEYARTRACDWGYYHNSYLTRVGMYCKALDERISSEASG